MRTLTRKGKHSQGKTKAFAWAEYINAYVFKMLYVCDM